MFRVGVGTFCGSSIFWRVECKRGLYQKSVSRSASVNGGRRPHHGVTIYAPSIAAVFAVRTGFETGAREHLHESRVVGSNVPLMTTRCLQQSAPTRSSVARGGGGEHDDSPSPGECVPSVGTENWCLLVYTTYVCCACGCDENGFRAQNV